MADILSQAGQIAARAEMVAREKICVLYVAAFDRGDISAVAAILQQAQGDNELYEMLQGIEAALYEEMEQELAQSEGGAQCEK